MLDIRPISDLRNEFTEIEKKIKDSNKPIVFTKNGKGSMVLMSLDRYSRMAHVEYIEQALDEADAYSHSHPEEMSHDEVFSKIRAKVDGKKL